MVTIGSILSGTFRFVGQNIRSVLIWSGMLTLLSLASMLAMRPLYAQQLVQAQNGTPAMPNFGLFGLLMLVFTIVFVAQFAAVFRAVLFPQESRFAYLRLGMDELRLFGTMLVLGLGGGVAAGLIVTLCMIVVGLISAAIGGFAVGVMGLLVIVSMFFVTIFFWVRLSLAGPLTILQRKVVIGPAWRVSRGKFWRLFGAYFVICLVILVAYILIGAVQMGPAMVDMFRPTDPAAHQRVLAWQAANYGFSLRTLVFAVIGGLLYGFSTALQGGMIAVATAQLLDVHDGQHLSEVFE